MDKKEKKDKPDKRDTRPTKIYPDPVMGPIRGAYIPPLQDAQAVRIGLDTPIEGEWVRENTL